MLGSQQRERPVGSAVGGAHQESVSTSTNEYPRIDHQPCQQPSSARTEPSYISIKILLLFGFEKSDKSSRYQQVLALFYLFIF